jgi:hypothetical protein
MGMPIEELVAIVPPPSRPVDCDADWPSAAFLVGTEFPPDYRDLISRYGSGRFFEGHLEVFNPLTLRGQVNIKMLLEMCNTWREGPAPLPLDVHPKRPGLLPWGRDENGNTYCWLTRGKPERWPVVYLQHGWESDPKRFPIDVTGFLARYAMNEYKLTSEPFAEKDRNFTPSRK